MGVLKGYIEVLIALLLLVCYFVTNKAFQKRVGSDAASSMTYSCTRGFVTALLFFLAYYLINRHTPVITWYSAAMSAGLALFVVGYTLVGFKVMNYGSLSVYTVFLMLGGMILPYLYGVIWLNESVNPFRIAGIVIMIVSMFLPLLEKRGGDTASGNVPKQGKPWLFTVLCLLVFFMNGTVSVISKTHAAGVFSLPSSDSMTFVMLCALFNGILSGIILLGINIRKKLALKKNRTIPGQGVDTASGTVREETGGAAPRAALVRAVAIIVFLAAIFDGASFFFQQLGAAELPASVMYPIQTGGSIVLSALAGFLIFKEKPSKIALIGLCITFASTFLFLIE